ncbi:MAG: hypothetical protein H0U76_18700 [Ktedonobacteraceae bacterium]|nr:hypothetical protein [Ktedonobacteraceae bacterium]
MPQDIDIFPTPGGGRKPPLIPTLVVGGAFFFGLVVMIVLNRTELGLIVSQFGALWSVEKNRQIIIALVFRIVFTAVIFGAVALACCLTVYLVKHYRQDEEETPLPQGVRPQPRQQETRDQKSAGTILVRQSTGEQRELATRQPHRAYQMAHSNLATYEQVVRPATQLPVTPIPSSFPAQTTMMSAGDIREEESRGQVGTVYGDKVLVPEEHIEQSIAMETALATQHSEHEENGQPVYIEISLLKTVRMTLCVPLLHKRYPIKVDDLYSKARHLIAYLAWLQGESVKLDDMRTHIFGAGEADTEQVQNAFSTAKRDIRRRIDQAVEQATIEAGEQGVQILPDDLDIFMKAKNRKYSLPEYCRVIDLAFIEQKGQIIQQAEKLIEQTKSVPQYVKDACDALIKVYQGDFIEDLLAEDPDAIDPWVQNWAREPLTRYRDYYLLALLYAGEYRRKAANYADAAEFFAKGAMAACKFRNKVEPRFDTKVYFSKPGVRREGPHVILGEQMIRRAIACYGQIGSTTSVSRVYGLYEQQMLIVSGRTWTPHPETSRILEDALKQTGAYQFPDTIATPYDQDEVLVNVKSA